MKLVPFTVKETNLRVISSEIGKVVPVLDIVQALEIDKEALFEIINSNYTMFESFAVKVPVDSDQDDNTESKQKVMALNHYGCISLNMSLNQNNIRNAEKRSTLLRFQKWIMDVLVNTGKPSKQTYEQSVHIPDPNAKIDYISPKEAAEILERSYETVMRYIKKGKLKAYKLLNGHLLDREDVLKYKKIRPVRKLPNIHE
jgi:excisionase family DNA binding protein